MVCRDNLFRSIQCAHHAVLAYAQCVCDEASESEREMYYEFGLVMTKQLAKLRETSLRIYNVDPLNGSHSGL